MIESLTIHNIQGHKDSELEFAPGVNVIKGQSRAGKSSVMRAFKLCLFNKPRGDSYLCRQADDNKMSVTVGFDNGWVCRERTPSANKYILPEVDLAAIGTGVPEEVTAITNITELNFQGQHDRYFLLQDSPGEVGRRLNEFVNLSVIDTVLKNINSIVRAAHADTSTCETAMEDTERQLAAYADVDSAELLIKECELLHKEYEESYNIIRSVTDHIDLVDEDREKVQKIKNWLASVQDTVTSLDMDLHDMVVFKEGADSITALADDIEDLNGDLAFYDEVVSYETDCTEIESLLLQQSDAKIQAADIQELIVGIERTQALLEEQERAYALSLKHRDALAASINICPFYEKPCPLYKE
jgi:DNA repair exonuclease SbcCD ATPase subunit